VKKKWIGPAQRARNKIKREGGKKEYWLYDPETSSYMNMHTEEEWKRMLKIMKETYYNY
jgi:hypothetical protein